MDYKQIWDMALSRIELDLSRVNFNTWFRNTQIINYKEGVVIIGVPNDFVKEWLLQKHHKFILRILREIHDEVRGVDFHTVKLETLQKKAVQAKNKIIEPTNSLPLQDLYINKDDTFFLIPSISSFSNFSSGFSRSNLFCQYIYVDFGKPVTARISFSLNSPRRLCIILACFSEVFLPPNAISSALLNTHFQSLILNSHLQAVSDILIQLFLFLC